MYKRNCEIKGDIVFPAGMTRIALGVEYNGAEFNGFQKESSTSNTVQQFLEKALSSVAAEEVTLVCAGRTDAGVHAAEQVVHFDTLAKRPSKAWVQGVNTHLPDEIRVHWSHDAGKHFHARFSALQRRYRYVIYSGPVKPAALNKQITWTSYPLDIKAMSHAAQHLVGEHDFTSYRATQCQAKSPVRKVHDAHFYQKGDLLVFEICANAFLHHMVRNIVGALLEVGRGAKPTAWVKEVLELRDRRCAAATAPPWGLHLVHAAFPEEFAIPRKKLGPIFVS